MFGRLKQLRRRAWMRRALITIASLFVLLNFMAYMHARRMTHFVDGGRGVHHLEKMSAGEKIRSVLFGLTIPRPENRSTPQKFNLDFTTHSFASSDGINLEAWHIPAATSHRSRGLVIGFHGYMTCKSVLLRQANALHEIGFDVMLVDFRGAGGSTGSDTTIGYREADDVAASVEYAQRTFHPSHLILYGESMGSAAILHSAAIHPDQVHPDAMILECPFDRLLSTVANRFTYMHLPSFPLARMLMFWGSVQQHYWAFSMNPINDAPRVTCPALFLHGGNDPWVTPAEAQALFNRLGSSDKRFVSFAGLGHEQYFPRVPDQWTQTVAGFLNRF